MPPANASRETKIKKTYTAFLRRRFSDGMVRIVLIIHPMIKTSSDEASEGNVIQIRLITAVKAEAMINSLGLNIAEVVYEPSMFKNIVLDVRVCDSSLVTGTRLEEGTQVTLVIGKGKGEKQVTVPPIVGKSLEEARSWLLANSLTMGSVEYDIQPSEEIQEQYVIYQQTPQSGIVVVEGTSVNIKLTTDIEKALVTGGGEAEEEDFF